MISNKQLVKWKQLASEATAGPWTDDGGDRRIVWKGTEPVVKAHHAGPNAAFIAAARAAVPALCEEVERLHAVIREYIAWSRAETGEADGTEAFDRLCKAINGEEPGP